MRLFKPILLLDGGAYNGLRDRILSEIRWRFLCTKFHIHGFILHIFPDFLKNLSKSLSWDIFWKSKLRFAAWTSQIFSHHAFEGGSGCLFLAPDLYVGSNITKVIPSRSFHKWGTTNIDDDTNPARLLVSSKWNSVETKIQSLGVRKRGID